MMFKFNGLQVTCYMICDSLVVRTNFSFYFPSESSWMPTLDSPARAGGGGGVVGGGRAGPRVWGWQVDSSHPESLARTYPRRATAAVAPDATDSESNGRQRHISEAVVVEGKSVQTMEWWRDLSGRPRFVRLKVF